MEQLEQKYIRLSNELTDVILKAFEYEKQQVKRSAGGRKSSANMTAEERSARARKAAKARFKKDK